jgi:PAS domain S-box-containing protein
MRILVADDHEIVRNGIRALLTRDPNLFVCGEAIDGQDAIEKAETLRPDLIVMDVSMPRVNGLEATREIRRRLPRCEVVIVTQHGTAEMLQQALKAGARGYVTKASLATDLLSAIDQVARQKIFVQGVESPEIKNNLDAQEVLQRSVAFEKALQESEERFRAAMSNMAEGLYTVDSNGLLTYINASAEKMLGWSSDELLGNKMHDVTHYMHPDGSPFPSSDCPGLQVLEKGVELREHDDVFIRKDGSFLPVVFSASPLKMNGGIRGIVICFRDDTKRREAEAARKRDFASMKTGGEMGDRIRAKDWSQTPIGPMETWSPSLRMMVGFVVTNRFPQLLWWGPQFCSLYNDAYAPILGTKHPWALGLPVSEVWKEIWDILQPLIETPFHGGPATWMEDIPLEINRHGFLEETHFTIAYSPVPDATVPGGIGGVLATVHEISEKVVAERRVRLLAELSARSTEAKTAEGACVLAAEVLAGHPKDVPFALIYLIDQKENQAKLAGWAGTEPGSPTSPREIALDAPSDSPYGWILSDALRSEQMTVVQDLGRRFESLPRGPWSQPPDRAVILPIRSSKEHEPAGVLIAGISSRLALGPLYSSFFELVGAQIAAAISNARAYEDERRRAEALAEIDRVKTLFFSNVSHEFRTPLTLMLGPIEELLAKEGLPADDVQAQLEVIHRNGLRLLKLVNTLLDFSRIEAGRTHANFVETELAAGTLELASVFRSAMEKGGLKYIVDCSPLAKPVFVDPDMWEKIVFNLLSNAFKFTAAGEVQVTLHEDADHAVLRVRDTGIGIPAEELPNVFKRFHRIENARGRTQEGTGIGLALAHELVKLHGGTMDVESQHGIGTTFIVRVPFGKEHLPPGQIGVEPRQASTALRAEAFVDEALTWLVGETGKMSLEEIAPSTGTSFGVAERPRILLAEDNADMREYVGRLLQPAYSVETVSTGAAALKAAQRHVPALILSDIMMPEMNGLDLVRHLRADDRFSTVPIILLSARAGEEARIEGVAHGADDYLTKPFSARELLARVAAHLELARLRKQTEQSVRQRTAQFETLLNEAPLGVYLVDADFRIVQMNPTALRAFSEIPDPLGRDFEEVTRIRWPKEHADQIVERFRQTLKTGESYVVPEQRRQRREGDVPQYYEWQIHRIPLPDGRFGVVCYFRDTSAQVHARLAIAESEERLRSLADSLEAQVLVRTGELEQRSNEALLRTAEMRDLSARLLQAQDEERRHIARELHDSVGGLITTLGMSLAAVADQARKSAPELTKAAESNQQLVQRLSQEIRTMSYLLYPPLLDETGLADALRWYVEGLRERNSMEIELSVTGNFGRISREIELVLFRLVQECLTNIHRHSQSKKAYIRLSREGQSVRLQVEDDGIGIPPQKLRQIQSQGAGVGIRGMRERVQQFQGEMDIHSNGSGTKISFMIPVKASDSGATDNGEQLMATG